MTKRDDDIRVKRIYDPPSKADGARVLVDRLWPRGLRKDQAALRLWLKDVAPSPDLRVWFGHKPERFVEFGQRYRAELAQKSEAIARLEALLKEGPVTLLHAAHDETCNHARVLAAFLKDSP